jgi:pilus assembly protein CpaC
LGALKEKTVDLIEIKEEEAIVDIDVQVLELGKGAQKQLGLAWPTSVTLTEPAGRFKATLAGIPDAFFRISEWTRGTFSATLSFLESEGKARVLSQPRLACQSGKEAELVVGGEKPIFTTSVAGTGATGTGVEYKEYGIKLKIKPSVTKDKRIKLALNVEVSELESTTAEYLGTSGDATAKAYPLKKRSASTELFLNDGQTMAIGGLIKQKTVEDLSKFPWLADIPVLGLFFRSRSRTYGGGMSEKGDSELFIILTPTIIAAKEQAEKTPVSKAGGETKPPLGRQENISAELKDYINAVQLKIMNAIYYPEEAEELGWEGTVGLVLRLASDGNLKEARILQSSGYKLLDEAALEVVQKQTPYPVFPKQIKLEELRIQVPVVYRRD